MSEDVVKLAVNHFTRHLDKKQPKNCQLCAWSVVYRQILVAAGKEGAR